jgi:5-epi-alpha-selinene synthase
VNPRVELLDEHLDAVADRYGERGTTERARWRSVHFGLLAARMYPEAQLDLLTLSAEALVWLFEYDDHLVDLPPESEQQDAHALMLATADVLAGRQATRPASPLGLLWDICLRARTIGGEAWWVRFGQDAQDFADLMYDESRSRAERRPPSPESYRRLRRGTSGWALLTDLAELVAGQPLPEHVVRGGRYRELRWAAGDLACAINDLLSHPKELAAGEYHNLVMVLEHSRRIDVAEARAIVTGMIPELLADYLRIRAEFLAEQPLARDHVRALEHLMRGSLDWSIASGRYPELVDGGSHR